MNSPENFFAWALGSGWGAPLASPSSVMVGTVISGPAASFFSSSSYVASPCGESEPPAVVLNHDADVIRIVERGGASLKAGVIEIPLR